jgi:DNA (cytosine-5)-methyltransferase 1
VQRAIGELSVRIQTDFDDLFETSRDAPSGPVAVVDLFSGCGGMSAGFRAVNSLAPAYRLVGAADIDAVANRSFESNLGLRPDEVDVSEMASGPERSAFLDRVVRERRDDPLVLIGCAPCQGFSSHRNSAGRDDPRNDLFGDFVKIARFLQPEIVVVENVPELLTDGNWSHVARARRSLERCGYQVWVSISNMAWFGVPQDRFRALLLASRVQAGPPSPTWALNSPMTVRDAIGHLPGRGSASESWPDFSVGILTLCGVPCEWSGSCRS